MEIFLSRFSLILFPLICSFFPVFPVAAEINDNDLLGREKTIITEDEDNLYDIARQNGLGVPEIVAANGGIDPWMPGEDTKVLLPKAHLLPPPPRQGIIINLAEMRLYYFSRNGEVLTFPVSVGTEANKTPMGTSRITRKRKNPIWIPPPSMRKEDPDLPAKVMPGPDNPLGTRALNLGWPGVVIHGTDKPWGIGLRASHGCIRMYPGDIEKLYELVAVGTTVRTISQPYSIGWDKDKLMLEIHPPLPEAEEIMHTSSNIDAKELREKIESYVSPYPSLIDWDRVDKTIKERRGVPESIM